MGLEIVCAGKNWKKGGKNVGKSILIKRLQCFIENTLFLAATTFLSKKTVLSCFLPMFPFAMCIAEKKPKKQTNWPSCINNNQFCIRIKPQKLKSDINSKLMLDSIKCLKFRCLQNLIYTQKNLTSLDVKLKFDFQLKVKNSQRLISYFL